MVFFWTCFFFGAYDCRGDKYEIWGALMSLGMQKHVLFSVKYHANKNCRYACCWLVSLLYALNV